MRLLIPLLLAACASSETLDSRPPPVQTDLYTGSVVQGEPMDIVVEGANPFDTIELYGGVRGPGAGPCPSQFGGTCLDVRGARALTQIVADANGRAEGSVRVPDTLTVPGVHLQAISGGWVNSYTTHVVARTVQSTPPMPLNLGLTDPPEEPYWLEDMRVEGDTLFLDVSYSGGCADHTFFAQWDGSFAESIPEQAFLEVLHNPSGDFCDAILFEELRVDLSSVRAAAPSTAILINLGGMQVLYEFL